MRTDNRLSLATLTTLLWFPLVCLLVTTSVCGQTRTKPTSMILEPVIEGPWIRIAGNPDLGKWSSDNQQPVDFAVWKAADGSWQAWSCIRNTRCGGNTRLLYRWEGKDLLQPDWTPKGVAMMSQPELGEVVGGLQAPHVIQAFGQYHMFYGDWNNICHAISEDGKTFERVIQSDGKTGMFSEGPGVNTRDVMMHPVGDLWYAYYTAFPNDQGAVYARTTRDFVHWSPSEVVAFGGITTTGRYSAECPHVITRHGRHYLFRTQHYGKQALSTVYHSEQPGKFGINQDDRYLLTRLAVAAPEIVRHENQDYIVALTPELDGLQVAKLDWRPRSRPGSPLWDFDDPEVRQAWQVASDLEKVFTQSTRSDFHPPQGHFIGTGEVAGELDDDRQITFQSPAFTVQDTGYWVYLSGGPSAKTYLALMDVDSGEEIRRMTVGGYSNHLQPRWLPTDQWLGRKVALQIVDQASGGWGHINFGGLYTARRPSESTGDNFGSSEHRP